MQEVTAEQARRRKKGYMRSARLSKRMGCELRKNDVIRALFWRRIQRNSLVGSEI